MGGKHKGGSTNKNSKKGSKHKKKVNSNSGGDHDDDDEMYHDSNANTTPNRRRQPERSASHMNQHGAKKNRKGTGNGRVNFDTADDAKLRDAVEGDGTKTIIDIDADGNCLFRSLSDQLYYDYGNRHFEVRTQVCDYLEAYEEEFKFFLVLDDDDANQSSDEGEDAKDFDSYVHNMRQDGEWGGNLELVVAARLYRRNITVFSANMAAFTIDHDSTKKTPNSGPDMFLSYHDNQHYNSVRINSRSKPPPPPIILELPEKAKTSTTASSVVTENGEEEKKDVNTNGDAPAPTSGGGSSSKTKRPVGRPPKLCPCGSGLRYKNCCDENANGGETTRPVGRPPKLCPCGSGLQYKNCCDENTKGGETNRPVGRPPKLCPCGSGLRYKKCCLAKEKREKRLQKLMRKEGGDDTNIGGIKNDKGDVDCVDDEDYDSTANGPLILVDRYGREHTMDGDFRVLRI